MHHATYGGEEAALGRGLAAQWVQPGIRSGGARQTFREAFRDYAEMLYPDGAKILGSNAWLQGLHSKTTNDGKCTIGNTLREV
jgi:hypothetical protein